MLYMSLWIIWFVMGICFVAVFAVMVFPKLMLRTYAATLPVRDRTVGRETDGHGEVLVCEPSALSRRYIRSYRVGRDKEGMYFRGERAKRAAFLAYDLIVFGASNTILQILHVKEKFNSDPFTETVRLPKRTDLVILRVVCADDTPFPPERRPFNARYALWLTLLSLSLAFTVDLFLWLCVTFACRILDRFTMTVSLPLSSWAALLGVTALAVVAVCWAVSLARFFLLRGRGKDENGR